ncbi:MAG: hypothetical protein QOJ35_4240 [Solirubrobacteraceae bacterium]|nr:hypothetical protein [Solirubrobacteraceae bacterium]
MSSSLPDVVASDRGPGLHVEPGVVIPRDTVIAPHVTIYAGVEIGDGVVLGQGAIVGRPQQRDARSRTPVAADGLTTRIASGCEIGSGTVVDAGATLLTGARVADLAVVRTGAILEEDCMLGWCSGVSFHGRIGPRTRIQNGVSVGPWTQIGADVLISPGVTLVGDPTMGRRRSAERPPGVVLGRACRIGTNAIIMPVEIGEEAIVGAASVVQRDVPARTVVVGIPARAVRAVRDDELLEEWG